MRSVLSRWYQPPRSVTSVSTWTATCQSSRMSHGSHTRVSESFGRSAVFVDLCDVQRCRSPVSSCPNWTTATSHSLDCHAPRCDLDRLQSFTNAAPRLTVGAQRQDHITPLLADLHRLRMPRRIQYKLCVLGFPVHFTARRRDIYKMLSARSRARNQGVVYAQRRLPISHAGDATVNNHGTVCPKQTWIQELLIQDQDQDQDSAVSRPRPRPRLAYPRPRPRPRLQTYKSNTGSP